MPRAARVARVEPELTTLDAMASPALFGPLFAEQDWRAWRAFLATVFGLVGRRRRPG